MTKNNKRVCFFLPSLRGGGAEKMTLNLVKGFICKGYKVDLVLVRAEGQLLKQIPDGCNLIDLKSKRTLLSLLPFIKYLIFHNPCAIISGMRHVNIIAIIANLLNHRKSRIIVIEHSPITESTKITRGIKGKLIPYFLKYTYYYADYVVAISKGVADDLKNYLKKNDSKIKIINNPIVDEDLFKKGKCITAHPWFRSGSPPVIISIGRLNKVKDYPTLIKAFSIVRKEQECNLVILGEGEERKNLEKLVKKLNISEYVWMPGWEENPYKYLSRAKVFVLTSLYEGFGNVLVEAMAFGIPIIATRCKGGPSEILENGKFGKLVPIGDYKTLAKEIKCMINNDDNINIEMLKNRATNYSIEIIIEKYIEIIENKGVYDS